MLLYVTLCLIFSFFTVIQASGQKIVTGEVTNINGEALTGVSVLIKNTGAGTATDRKGKFKLTVPNNKAVLVFTHTGYEAHDETIGDRTSLTIVLQEGKGKMDEVVVIGYGTAKRKDLTGAVGIVNIQDLNKAPVPSFDYALQGRVAGVTISSNDGQPGSQPNITIRGVGSLTQNTSPLYVVDGFPMESFNPSDLNPNDIASITVLKDASSTAIYGARGSNGVIMIETKKGRISAPVITYSGSMGINSVTKKMKMMDPYEFIKFNLERFPSVTIPIYFPNLAAGDTPDPSIYKNVPGIDWQDLIFQNGVTQIHNLSLTGGTKDTKYSLSGSIYNQDGIVIYSNYKRYQGRISLDQTVNSKVTAGVNINYSKSKSSGTLPADGLFSGSGTSSLFFSVWGYRPIAGPLPTDNAELEENLLDPTLNPGNDFRINPVINLQNQIQDNFNTNFIGNAYFTYKIANNLSLRVQGGVNNRLLEKDYFYNSKTAIGVPRPGITALGVQGGISNYQTSIWSNENTVSYKRSFLRDHQIEILGGLSFQEINSRNAGLAVVNIPNEELVLSGLDEGIPLSNTALVSSSTLQSSFGRLNYSYKSKYLATFSFRADGSSKFAPGNRWGYFPSGAFAWKMSEEKFMQKILFISDAKLRASYGASGNNRVGDFDYLSSIVLPISNYYSFNNQTPSRGAVPGQIGNDQLTWETSKQFDLGYDLSLFNSRISLTVDAYRKRTDNLLLRADLPLISGYSSAYKNVGSIQNEGLELSFNTLNIKKSNFSWESSFNISFNRNKVLSLNSGQNELLTKVAWDGNYPNPLYRASVGGPAAEFYGLIWDGVYQYSDFDLVSGKYVLKPEIPTNGNPRANIYPGDIKYRDINTDGIINTQDFTTIGRTLPKHTGGFGNNFSYKRISLNVFFQWSYGNQIFNANRVFFEGGFNVRTLQNQFASYADRWEPDNPSNKYFRASAGASPSSGAGPNGYVSSMDIEDGSYLRLKTVSLDYALPGKYLQRVGIKSLALSLSGQNLYTWTKYSGMDPEVSVRNSILTPGFDFSAYPRAKTLVFGLKATF
jgi:TonB-dependent starch-binding outer membrane protein SusC